MRSNKWWVSRGFREGGWDVRTGWRDAGSFSAESWWACSRTGPSAPPSTPASPSAGDKTRPLRARIYPRITTFWCFIVNIFTKRDELWVGFNIVVDKQWRCATMITLMRRWDVKASANPVISEPAPLWLSHAPEQRYICPNREEKSLDRNLISFYPGVEVESGLL